MKLLSGGSKKGSGYKVNMDASFLVINFLATAIEIKIVTNTGYAYCFLFNLAMTL